MNKYSPEQFDQLLSTRLDNEQPNLIWKHQLISKLEKFMHATKPKRHWKLWLGGLVLATAGVVTVMLNQDQLRPYNNRIAAGTSDLAGPFYMANDWTRNHVSYHFKEGVTVPAEFPKYELQYVPFNRTTLDVIAQQLNPELLDQVTQNGNTLLYAGGDQTLDIQQQEDGSVNYDYYLIKQTSIDDPDYVAKSKVRLSHENQMTIVQNYLKKYPELTAGYQVELLNMQYGESVETLFLTTLDSGYRFEAANFVFFGGELESIYGSAITGVQNVGTTRYGDNASIENYLNWNPVFPFYSLDFPDDVYVRYIITGYELTNSGLQLNYEMENADATLKALKIPVDELSEGSAITNTSTTLDTLDKQQEYRTQAEQYMNENKTSGTCSPDADC